MKSDFKKCGFVFLSSALYLVQLLCKNTDITSSNFAQKAIHSKVNFLKKQFVFLLLPRNSSLTTVEFNCQNPLRVWYNWFLESCWLVG